MSYARSFYVGQQANGEQEHDKQTSGVYSGLLPQMTKCDEKANGDAKQMDIISL